jgi:undecaprenyl-diphosphatase
MKQGALIGIVQGLCLPFRGFSRSGATISTGLLAGVEKSRAEAFSFALAVVITPAADGREVLRLMKVEHIGNGLNLATAMMPSLLGMVCAFVAGLLALKWLSKWLESDRWYLFGIYCLAAAVAVGVLSHMGY